jgi:hypothetical protein
MLSLDYKGYPGVPIFMARSHWAIGQLRFSSIHIRVGDMVLNSIRYKRKNKNHILLLTSRNAVQSGGRTDDVQSLLPISFQSFRNKSLQWERDWQTPQEATNRRLSGTRGKNHDKRLGAYEQTALLLYSLSFGISMANGAFSRGIKFAYI